MEKNLDLLLSGPGLIGKKHAALIKTGSGVRLKAVVAPNDPEGENASLARTFGAKFFTDFDEALAKEHPDGVIISSPNVFHYAQAAAAIRRNIPVLVEKPITDDIVDAFRLVQMSHANNVPVLVGHHRTYNPLIEVAQDFIESPAFGRPVVLQGSALFYKPEHYFREGLWRTKKGGGPILINLIHEIGLMRYFFGHIDGVFAVASNNIRNFEVEDTVSITFMFSNGAMGSFVLSDAAASSKSWEMTSGENPDYSFLTGDYCYHFAGTNGSIDFPTMKARHYSNQAEASWWKPFILRELPFPHADPLAGQLMHFADVIRHGVPPRVSARDGYLNLLVVEAIMRSINTGAMVSLSEVETDVQAQATL